MLALHIWMLWFSPLIWVFLQIPIVITIAKICRRKSSNAFLGAWNLDFLLWVVTSIVFFDWSFRGIIFFNGTPSVGVDPYWMKDFFTYKVMANCYIIFLLQFLLFLVSLGRSIYKKDFLMFLHKFLLLLSGFVVWFHISAFI
jgi:hypothetical protein